jgi:hypothetical protein
VEKNVGRKTSEAEELAAKKNMQFFKRGEFYFAGL